MALITVQTPFAKDQTINSLGEFMGIAFDYYNDLEDRLFGRIIQDTNLSDTVDTEDFLATLHTQNEAHHKQSIHKGHKVIAK